MADESTQAVGWITSPDGNVGWGVFGSDDRLRRVFVGDGVSLYELADEEYTRTVTAREVGAWATGVPVGADGVVEEILRRAPGLGREKAVALVQSMPGWLFAAPVLQEETGTRRWLIWSEEDDTGTFEAATAAEAVDLWRAHWDIEDGQSISVVDCALIHDFKVEQTNADPEGVLDVDPEFRIVCTNGPAALPSGDGERGYDATGAPLCFECGRPQREHADGNECAPAPPSGETGGRRMLDTVLGPVKINPECRVAACCGNGKRCWEAGRCLRDPAAAPPAGETRDGRASREPWDPPKVRYVADGATREVPSEGARA